MNIAKQIADELQIKVSQVEAVIQLIDEGNTIPFIARYRKEAHGALNDEVLRSLDERLTYLRNLEEKKASVLVTLEELEVLTPELRTKMDAAMTLAEVEDIYRPYRPKRRTRAMIAKEKGLEPLANLIVLQMTKKSLEEEAAAYLSEEKGVASVKDALDGAQDILAERISDDGDFRAQIRTMTWNNGSLTSAAKDETLESVYETYYQFQAPLTKISGHQVLAVNRGEKEKILTVKIEAPKERILGYLEKKLITSQNPNTTPILKAAAADAYERLIGPAIERELRSTLTETAEEGGMKVFGKNLRQLFMQPPIAGETVLGWDPAFRTGCKLAVIDPFGKVLDTTVIYPTAPHNEVEKSKQVVKRLIEKYHITLISVGNGTASRESELVIVELLKEIKKPVRYLITNEAGASVYSASKQATAELPGYDVGQRSAISIARRVQDPLAELVKIDPKAIGVGQYQHDMNQKKLGEVLHGIVEDCVNQVGVDLNTASAALLGYVSGISSAVAQNIVTYREENGRFTNRKQLLKVAKLGPKAYEQCAGFLRIREGDNPLDATAVHPESYAIAQAVLKQLGYEPKDILTGAAAGISKKVNIKKLAAAQGIGEMTLTDILKELEKPSRDPRDEMPKPILRSDVLSMEDLKPEMVLKGTVRNVVDFGAFVDIGVHQDGLVHLSQITNRYIKHPSEVLQVGDIVEVKVLSVDAKKKRIGLTMKGLN
ncbi:MAG: RNA-binding transcriptional accessory protein [Lachnospiraceae bacterium]|nr:RNA-binding transcriptional accessory protein [Lachnospiraceae bacterium]